MYNAPMKLEQLLNVVAFNTYLDITGNPNEFRFVGLWTYDRCTTEFNRSALDADVIVLLVRDDIIYVKIKMASEEDE